MKRSSKILLVVCFCLAVMLVTSYIQLQSESMPEFSRQDGVAMLAKLARGFEKGSTREILSFAYPDATVAGRKLESIENLLTQAFRSWKDPRVEFTDLHYSRNGSMVILDCNATAREGASKEVLVATPVTFTLRRREISQMGGLFVTYEWKVSDVAAQLPQGIGF